MQYQPEKFVNAAVFFAKKVNKLGITKLNKLLYYIDFEHYRLYGRPILGDVYIRMEKGPVPKKSYSVFKTFRDNTNGPLEGLIYLRPEIFSLGKRETIVAKRAPDLTVFSKSEIEIMEKWAFIWKDALAKTVSEQSHLERPWKETAELQDIDYKLGLNNDSISREYAEYREMEDQLLERALSK